MFRHFNLYMPQDTSPLWTQTVATIPGKEALLYRLHPDGKVVCTACARYCRIGEGQIGLCGIRGVNQGKLHLYVYGKVITGHVDPIEKKPVTHYMPGTKIFSIATTGCNWLCHPAGTQVLMADGREKNVEDLLTGDAVWSYDTENGMRINPSIVTHVGARISELWEVRYGSHGHGKLLLTEEHPVLTQTGWKPVNQLQAGDHILKVWHQNTENWKKKRAVSISHAKFNCTRCGAEIVGLDDWNRHRVNCYTQDIEEPAELLALYSHGMRSNNPMKSPDVVRHALHANRMMLLLDPSHGWHKNVERLRGWLHRHPSAAQAKLYEMLDSLGVTYEKQYKIFVEKGMPYAKSCYIADVAFPDVKLDVEVDGRWLFHDPKVAEEDRVRDEALRLNGWEVLRVSSSYLFNHPEEVKALIAHRLSAPVMVNKRQWMTVSSVRPSGRVEPVYSFECIPNHNYVAEGVVVHNCAYCFPPYTLILTDRGFVSIEQLFNRGKKLQETDAQGVTEPEGVSVLTHKGRFRKVKRAFRHYYSGDLITLKPYYLPSITCTPDHRILVADISSSTVRKVRAEKVGEDLFLAIPKLRGEKGLTAVLDSKQILGEAIEAETGHKYPIKLIEEDKYVRLSSAKHRGVPNYIPVDAKLAALFGLYCAEGRVVKSSGRRSGYSLVFAFGEAENELINTISELLTEIFGESPSMVRQGSEKRLCVYNSALALLFKELAGGDCYSKRVPYAILHSDKREIVESFIKAYLLGDGYCTTYIDEQRAVGSTSVSKELSMGVAYCLLRLGNTPRLYISENPATYTVEGGLVNRSNDHMVRMLVKQWNLGVNGFDWEEIPSRLAQNEHYFFIPIRGSERTYYEGYVYNLEVEEDHTYCANFYAVSNCQNFDISQRRKVEGLDASPEQVVAMAKKYRSHGIAYTYNEPTIFMEYAHDIGVAARREGLINIFVTNGFWTPDTVQMAKDFLDCATVDFKGSGEKGFVQRYIGIPDSQPIFDTLLEIRDKTKIHLEVTDLIVPEIGDNLDAARRLSRFVYENLGPETPIHFLRFHPDYRLMHLPWTPVETLERHCQVAKEEGLRYVYIGNVTGHPYEHTYCPGCGKVVVERRGYDIVDWRLDDQNRCPDCGYAINIIGRPPRKSVAGSSRFIPVLWDQASM